MACRDLETNKALYISPLSAKGCGCEIRDVLAQIGFWNMAGS